MRGKTLAAGAAFPNLSWPVVGGNRMHSAGGSGWRLLVVYRGKHCPLCKAYLNTLNALMPSFAEAGISVLALSADPLEKAQSDVREFRWTFPVGYDLHPSQMRQLGLYISKPLSANETDRPFAEPAAFVVNPKGQAQIIDISNAPFARPDLHALLSGLKYVIARRYPIRGAA